MIDFWCKEALTDDGSIYICPNSTVVTMELIGSMVDDISAPHGHSFRRLMNLEYVEHK